MKYRKKPVVVEAVQWTGDNDEIIRLLCEHCGADYSEAADVAQLLINNGVTFRG